MSGCDPDTIIHNHPHRHSLACRHEPFLKSDGGVVYLEGDEFHENCGDGHTHKAKLHLTESFNRVARANDAPEDIAAIEENYVFIDEEGVAELRKYEPDAKGDKYSVLGVLLPL